MAEKRKPGRPPKAPEDRRTEVVPVFLTPRELARLQALADAENCTKSEWLAKPLREGK